MAKGFNKLNFYELLNFAGIGPNGIRNWNAIQAEANAHTIVLIESNVDEMKLFNPEVTKNNKLPKTIDKNVRSFLSKRNQTKDKLRAQIKKDTSRLGLLIPVEDIKEVFPKDLRHAMNIQSQLLADFRMVDFLDTLVHVDHSIESDSLPRPIMGMLYLIEKYVNQILYSNSLRSSVEHLDGWLSYNVSFDKNMLGVQQFISWICLLIDEVICNDHISVNYGFEGCLDIVGSLIQKYREPITLYLYEVKASNAKKFYFANIPEFNKDLAHLLKYDNDLMIVGKVIDFRNRINNIDNKQVDNIIKKAIEEDSLSKRLGRVLSQKNIINRVRSILNDKHVLNDFSLFKNNVILPSDYARYNGRLDEDEFKLLVETGQRATLLGNDILLNFYGQTQNEYIVEIGNMITRPLFLWQHADGGFYPVLNLAGHHEVQNTLSYLERKKAQEEEEAKQLEKYLKAIKVIYTQTALDNLEDSVPNFFFQSNQNKWNLAVKQAEEIIKMRSAYRQQKMIELGLDQDDEYTYAQKEVFLSEMLKIENEIQKFVPFVTSAFQSALPSKRSTEFDPYRHQSDGIEFDPETVFIPEKWMRGNVMRTLKTKIKKGEVNQVNCFCLDLSGSMFHTRMRNLYKILYLLVTGLQSRKSFDAFHFFSNDFIPGVDFDYEYTRKNLLFKVLTTIAQVDGTQLDYAGLEGTNISDGIRGCEERMRNFVDTLKTRNPSISLSCSMFVITDGEPSLGIVEPMTLNKYIQERRDETNYAIKGIYIKSAEDKNQFIAKIFGESNAVESSSFEEGVQKLTSIMTKTYKEQRQNYKWEKKRSQLTRK